MKTFLIFALFSSFASANSFSYKDRPYSFELRITKVRVDFSSESFTYSIPVSPCNIDLAKNLNAEVLGLAHSEKNGSLTLLVDGRKVSVEKKSKLRDYLRSMGIRMRQFGLEEKKKCG